MAIKIAVANPKGGVGKSTTTLMVTEGLALQYGARILVIDMDPHAGSTKNFLGYSSLEKLSKRRVGLATILHGWSLGKDIHLTTHCLPASDLAELRDRGAGLVDIIPSNHELMGELGTLERTLQKVDRREDLQIIVARLLTGGLKPLERNYDVIILDCPAGAGSLTLAACRAADHLIVPTSLEEHAYTTVVDFFRFVLTNEVELFSQIHPVITMYHANNPIQRRMLKHLVENTNDLRIIPRPVPYATSLQNAQMHQGPGSYRNLREKYGSSAIEMVSLSSSIAQRINLPNRPSRTGH